MDKQLLTSLNKVIITRLQSADQIGEILQRIGVDQLCVGLEYAAVYLVGDKAAQILVREIIKPIQLLPTLCGCHQPYRVLVGPAERDG